jgi:hypothetical protein
MVIRATASVLPMPSGPSRKRSERALPPTNVSKVRRSKARPTNVGVAEATGDAGRLRLRRTSQRSSPTRAIATIS